VAQLAARRECLLETYRNVSNETLMINDGKDRRTGSELCQQKEALLKETNDKRLLADQIISWVDRRCQDFHLDAASKDAPLELKF
jgi:hypothetical protein